MRSLPLGRRRIPVPEEPFRLEVPSPPTARGAADPLDALGRPIGAPPLAQALSGCRRVLIVVADGTRATGSSQFLPALVEAIERAGRPAIRFIVASGIHRAPRDDELEEILGPELRNRYPVLRHAPDEPEALVSLGRTRRGTPLWVHEAVRRHDALLLTGAVGFHYYAGFSGGRKAVVPGLAGRATVEGNHGRALRPDGSRHPAARAGVLRGNPVHLDMLEGAARVRPRWLVNTVLDEEGGIERLYAGHWRRAHLAACAYVRRTRTLQLVPRDVVVCSAGGHPYDTNVVQAHKAFEAAIDALRPGGVFVLVASCREGAGSADFLETLALGDEAAMVEALRSRFRVYAQTALAWWRKARGCKLVMVSEWPPEQVRGLGAEPAADLVEAFSLARRFLPAGTRGWLIPFGARYLVRAAPG